MPESTSTLRLEKLRALLDAYGQAPEDYAEGEEEDLRPYFDGTAEPAEWVCVTTHNEKAFFLPHFADAAGAMSRAVEFADDDIFAETPTAVVSLDSGQEFRPEWSGLPWREAPRRA
jgi:hypothetical protein